MTDDNVIELHTFGERGLEKMLREEIYAALGSDKDALKAFQVERFKPETLDQAQALKRAGKPLFKVQGALGLDDSGMRMRAFSFLMESGLSQKKDAEVAKELAWQCKKCVAKMKRERKKDPAGLVLARG